MEFRPIQSIPEISNQKPSYMKEMFIHTLSMFSLYLISLSSIFIYYYVISVKILDPLETTSSVYASSTTTRMLVYLMSLVIVFTPVYIWTVKLIQSSIMKNPQIKDLKMRKFLLYITLFVTGVTILFCLVSVIKNFLLGELSLQFFLKLLSIIFVSVPIFSYYILDIKQD